MRTDFYVFVRFCEPCSREPRKWVKLLANTRVSELEDIVEEFGFSEFGNSLNLRIRVASDRLGVALERLQETFTGSETIGVFEKKPSTPEMQKIQRKAEIISLEDRRNRKEVA